MEEFVNKIHLFYHKDKNDFAKKIYITVERISNFFCKLILTEFSIGIILFNVAPVQKSYKRGMFDSIKPANATFDQCCYFDLPFDYTTNFTGWLIVFLYNCVFSYEMSSLVGILDLYLFINIFHLWGHIKILKYNLINIPRPAMKDTILNASRYSDQESKHITYLLKESITHYNLIKKYMDTVSETFGVAIGLYYLYHQISGCILLIEISEMTAEAIFTYGILTFVSFQQLIQMSVAFELIGSQTQTIKDAVYDVPWECMKTYNRKLVFIYLCNVQEPMHLKALGMVPVGVKTMASILKTSISYFMLLRTATATNV